MIKNFLKRKLKNFLDKNIPPFLENLSSEVKELNHANQSLLMKLNDLTLNCQTSLYELKQNSSTANNLSTALLERQKVIDAKVDVLEPLQNQLNLLRDEFNKINDTASLLARKQQPLRGSKLSIIFLIHHIAAIDSLLTVIQEAKLRGHKTIVITIKNNFLSSTDGGRDTSEENNHRGLDKLGIEHIRFGKIDSLEGLKLLKLLNPDYIFRQSPWDNDIEVGYSTQNLNFCKLCYTPYFGVQLTEDFNDRNLPFDLHVDQIFHRSAFAIFIEDDKNSFQRVQKHAILGSINVVPSGLPKYEYIFRQLREVKHKENSVMKTILWAPHHSFDEAWLGFATFLETYETIIETVKRLNFKLIFRPHPLFERNLLKSGEISKEKYEEFKKIIESSPNFTLSQVLDPIDDYVESDLLLIDGISMLATYQLTGKPIIWIDSERHAKFTPLGEEMIKSVTRIPSKRIDCLENVIKKILIDGQDDLAQKRANFASLLLGSGRPSQNILDFLEQQ